MSLPEGTKFTKDHEWASVIDSGVRVGITDYAQTELGDVVFVDLPQEGQEVTAGESFANIESVKAVSDIYAPVTGKVVAVNEALADAPELINSAAETDGWLVVIEASDASQLNALMSADDYSAFIEEVS